MSPELQIFEQRFRAAATHYATVKGESPKICIMGWDETLRFESWCVEWCKDMISIPLPVSSELNGKRIWFGIQIFEGDTAEGMVFGR